MNKCNHLHLHKHTRFELQHNSLKTETLVCTNVNGFIYSLYVTRIVGQINNFTAHFPGLRHEK
jgi:hypothetical protein